jgi:hypothetical protein
VNGTEPNCSCRIPRPVQECQRRIGRPAVDPGLISNLKGLLAGGKSLRQVGTMLGISVATVHKYSDGCA